MVTDSRAGPPDVSGDRVVSVVGGSGALGGGLARRWAKAGLSVIIGSRSADKAVAAAAALQAAIPGARVQGMDNVAAARAGDIVVLTVPFAQQRATLEGIQPALAGKILVDTTVPLVPPKVARVQLPKEGSAAMIAQQLAGDAVSVVAAFHNVIVTQDWHTPGHASFATSHAGKKPFETTKLRYGMQVLWPDHCVQGSADAALHKDLALPTAQLVIRKGFRKDTDSYSGFVEADGKTTTGLAGYLKARGIDEVYVCGLATDFCVAWTALDARKAGFKASVIEDACRGIDLNGSLKAAWANMSKAGVKRIQSADIAA